MLRRFATAGSKMFVSMSHNRDIYVFHQGNKVTFDIPLYFERGVMFKEAIIDGDRMIVNCIKRLDVEEAEKKEKEAQMDYGCCPKK